MPSMESPGLMALLRHSMDGGKRSKGGGGGGIMRMFKLLPMLTSGCKMAALLSKTSKALLACDTAATVTVFGYRKGRVSIAIQEALQSPPVFLIELPMLTNALHKEMASGLVRIALESETRTSRRRLVEEHVWAVYCNGRKAGYSIRRREASDEERYIMQLLRWVSMGAGVLPSPADAAAAADGELTYLRARFERVVGSKDSEALYMVNPDGSSAGAGGAPELSIFLVRKK